MEASNGKEEKRQESGKEKEKKESSKKEREKEVVEKIRKKSGQEKVRPKEGETQRKGGQESRNAGSNDGGVGGHSPSYRRRCRRGCGRRPRHRCCRRCGFPGRPSSGSRLLSGGFFLGRFFCGLLQRLPFPFLSCCFPLFLFLCRFLAFSLLCHGWPPSRVVKQGARPLGRGLSNLRGKPRRIEFLSCPADSIEAAGA